MNDDVGSSNGVEVKNNEFAFGDASSASLSPADHAYYYYLTCLARVAGSNKVLLEQINTERDGRFA